MLHLKDLRGQSVGEKVTGWDGKILKELEGPRSGGAWFAGHGGIVSTRRNHYSILVPYVNDYLQVAWILTDSRGSVWTSTGKYVRMQHFWTKGTEIVFEYRPHAQDRGVWHRAESNSAPSDEPKPKGMRHPSMMASALSRDT